MKETQDCQCHTELYNFCLLLLTIYFVVLDKLVLSYALLLHLHFAHLGGHTDTNTNSNTDHCALPHATLKKTPQWQNWICWLLS